MTTLGDRLAGAVGASTTRLMVPDDGQPAGFVLLGEPARAARREAALPRARLRQRRGGASSCLTADMGTPDWSDGRSVFASTLIKVTITTPGIDAQGTFAEQGIPADEMESPGELSLCKSIGNCKRYV